MGTTLYSRDKRIVKTVSFRRKMGSEKGEDGEIGRQGDGHGFFGMHAESSAPITWKKDKR